MRAHNERLVLTLLRRHGPLAKAELARLTSLSAQTVSVIVRQLEAEGLIARGVPRRGQVGQPSVPMHLAPGGAYFLGLKVGRRSMEMTLIDFIGNVIGSLNKMHRFPDAQGTIDFVRESVATLGGSLTSEARERIAGLGVGLPFHLWDWAEPLGVPSEKMSAWREIDLRARIADAVPYPVFLENDASAACNAEIVFGDHTGPEGFRDFAYAYIGYFVGGGLVLDGRLVPGRTGNAGALGSMPVPSAQGGSVQLIEVSSLSGLEALLRARGHDPARMWLRPDAWAIDGDAFATWCHDAAAGLAHVAASSTALLDLEALVIDGWMPLDLRARLISETERALARVDLSGATPPAIVEGSIGARARALGAASLPLSMRFLIETNALAA